MKKIFLLFIVVFAVCYFNSVNCNGLNDNQLRRINSQQLNDFFKRSSLRKFPKNGLFRAGTDVGKDIKKVDKSAVDVGTKTVGEANNVADATPAGGATNAAENAAQPAALANKDATDDLVKAIKQLTDLMEKIQKSTAGAGTGGDPTAGAGTGASTGGTTAGAGTGASTGGTTAGGGAGASTGGGSSGASKGGGSSSKSGSSYQNVVTDLVGQLSTCASQAIIKSGVNAYFSGINFVTDYDNNGYNGGGYNSYGGYNMYKPVTLQLGVTFDNGLPPVITTYPTYMNYQSNYGYSNNFNPYTSNSNYDYGVSGEYSGRNSNNRANNHPDIVMKF